MTSHPAHGVLSAPQVPARKLEQGQFYFDDGQSGGVLRASEWVNTFSLPAAPCGQPVAPSLGTQKPRPREGASPGLHPSCRGPGALLSVCGAPGQASQGQSWCPCLAWVLKPLSFLLSSLARLAYQVVKVKPHDRDAKMKYQECNKIVKQKAFERAIAGDEHKRSVVDSLDIESMSELGPGAPLCPACRGASGPRAHAPSVLLEPPQSRAGAGGLVRAGCLAVSVPQSHPPITGLICP